MITRTLFYPNSRNPELEVEVTSVGDIVCAFALIPAFDVWVDGMEYLKNRPAKIERIREDAVSLDWNDHGDDDFSVENLRDSVAQIIGVKQA